MFQKHRFQFTSNSTQERFSDVQRGNRSAPKSGALVNGTNDIAQKILNWRITHLSNSPAFKVCYWNEMYTKNPYVQREPP